MAPPADIGRRLAWILPVLTIPVITYFALDVAADQLIGLQDSTIRRGLIFGALSTALGIAMLWRRPLEFGSAAALALLPVIHLIRRDLSRPLHVFGVNSAGQATDWNKVEPLALNTWILLGLVVLQTAALVATGWMRHW